MVMLEVSLHDTVDLAEFAAYSRNITGVVGFAGTHRGALAIHLPEKTALTITSHFLGTNIESVNADVEDAVGELANMLGGNIKAMLSDKGKDIALSLPAIIKGKKYDFQAGNGVDSYILPLVSSAGEFCIELQLERN